MPTAAKTFKRRQRVTVLHNGINAEPATIVRPDKAWAGYWIVRCDDGNTLCVRDNGLRAA